MIGVMPMPPAMNNRSVARGGSAKSLTGGATGSVSPDLRAVDEIGRAAATGPLAFYRNQVAIALRRIVAQ